MAQGKFENKIIGMRAEGIAAKLMEQKGYTVRERNWSTKFGEIDIICQDGETMIFVEVKAKRGEMYGSPEEMFGRGKYNKVRRVAEVYLKGKQVKCRIDMVAVVFNGDEEIKRITHYQNVYF